MMKKVWVGFLITAILAGAPSIASAQTIDDLILQIKLLTSRVDSLERENAVQKTELSEFKSKPVPSSGNFVKSKGEIEVYGQVKTDFVFSKESGTNNSASGVTQTNASRPPSSGDHSEVQFSAQDTRLGFNLKGPDLDQGGKVSGKIEFDLFGNGSGSTASGTYSPRLRLAYFDLAFEKWSIRVGQDWDFFAPIGPSLLNPGWLFRAGNLGVRHAQATLTNKWGEQLGGVVTTKIGVLDSDDALQEDAGLPVIGAYAQYDKTIFGVKSSVGVGGLYGKLNTIGRGNSNEEITALITGLTLKFTSWLSFKSEGFIGAGLNKFQGGPAQTVDTRSVSADRSAIEVKGGFAEITILPTSKLETNVGIGIDDVKDSGSYSTADKSALWDSNTTYYTNFKYSLSKDVLVGVEYQKFDTKWFDGVKASDQRIQATFLYKF